MWHVLAVLAMMLAMAQPVAAQGDVRFTASVDRTTLALGETVTLDLVIEGTFQSSNRPDLPPFEGLSVVSNSQSSQFSMVNGKITSKVMFRYRLQAMREGEITIPAVPIRMGNQTYQTDPIVLQVSGNSSAGSAVPPGAPPSTPTQPAAGQAPTGIQGQGVFIEAEVDNPSPVVGEQITYRFFFYQAIRLYSQPKLDWPEFNGFLSYDLTPNLQTTRVVAERQYQVTEVRKALFATTPGQVTIPPSVLTIPGDFVNQTIKLQTEPVVVEVQPLPEGAPPSFDGAVGQFEISSWVDPTETRVNEPINLYVRISGTGNIATISDPTTDAEESLTEWRTYAPKTTTNENQVDNRIAGDRQFERPLVPRIEGMLDIPALALVYYDPQESAYRTIETAPVVVPVSAGDASTAAPVVISGGKQDVVVLANDIRHIKAAPVSVRTEQEPLPSRGAYWFGWIAPLAAMGATYAWDRHRRHLSDNVALARSLRAGREARKRLSRARREASENEDSVYATVAGAMTAYLADKFDLPAAGLTRDVALRQMATHAVPDEMAIRVLGVLEWADSGRFAPLADGRGVRDLIAEAEACVADIESILS